MSRASTISVAVLLTVAYAGVMFVLARYRVRSGVFDLNLDLIDPRNYRREGRWLILVAVPLALGMLIAWIRVVAGVMPNMRLKLAAPVLEGRIAFVIRTTRRRSLGAFR